MSLFADMARLEAEGAPFVLVTITHVGGSTPRLAGARMIVQPEGIMGTVGGGAFEQRVIEAGREMLAQGERTRTLDLHLVRDLGMCCGGRMTAFLDTVAPAPRLWIYGAGHVGTALAPAALAAGFAVTVVDARAEWADPARFPAAVTVLDQDPEDHVRRSPPPAEDYVVVVTHSHPLDEVLIGRLAAAPRRYLGLIGSRRKRALFERRLAARGLPEEAFAQVRCPMGLPIEAQTPAEIAVSVVGELIAVRRG